MSRTPGEMNARQQPDVVVSWKALVAFSKAIFARRSFLAAVVVLAVAAAGLNSAVYRLKLHFKKEPVEIRSPKFAKMPEIIGNWVQVAREDALDPEIKDALGTEQFLFCSYINASKLGLSPEALKKAMVDDKTFAAQREQVNQCLRSNPSAVLSLSLTYYTGSADTVAHVPERCYVGGGFDISTSQDLAWGLDRDLHVRHLVFNGPGGPNDVRNVAYFFHVNGQYQSDSLMVRMHLQNLQERYAYYAKVELMCTAADQAVSEQTMKDFLAVALPHAEACLPDWNEVKSRK